jgi:hypothetical protein
MSDLSLPLTSPVFLTGLEDVDIHGRYCELLKAYEAVVELRETEKRQAHQKISAIQTAAERMSGIQMKAGARRSTAASYRGGGYAEQDLRIQVLESKVELLQTALDESRGYCAELENDLKTAIGEGVKYRDSLKKIIELREREASKRSQEDEEAKKELSFLTGALESTKSQLDEERKESAALRQTLRDLTAKAFAKDETATEKIEQLQGQLDATQEKLEALMQQGNKLTLGAYHTP